MSMSEARDADLVRQVVRGDRDAFRPLVGRYEQRVYILAISWLGDPAEAQDVTQETFYAAYRRLPELKDAEKFRAWLFATARNLCRVWLRKRRLFGEPVPLETLEDVPFEKPHPSFEAAESVGETREELLTLLHASLDRLPDKYQTLLRLKYLSGSSYREIAEMMDLPEATVKSRLFEARRLLRERVHAGQARER